MLRLINFSISRPWWVVLIAAVLTLAAAPGLLRLRLRTDGHALIPPDAPEIQFDDQVRRDFDLRDQIVVMITADDPDGIFNSDTICLVAELTEAFEELPNIRSQDLFSLATEHGHRVVPGTLKFHRFLDPVPQTPDDLRTLRNDLARIKLYTGTLVSLDERSTAIFVGALAGVNRVELVQAIEETIEARRGISERISIIGAPVAESLLGTHLLEDLGVPLEWFGHPRTKAPPSEHPLASVESLRHWIASHVGLVPVVLIVMATIFLLSFRSVVAMMIPMIEAGAALFIVFGLMGWCDVPIYLTIAVLPVILVAMGVADDIHILARFFELRRQNPDHDARQCLRETMATILMPIINTSATTAIGFLSFALSPLIPVRMFGIFTAVGVVVCMGWSLFVSPALLSIAGSWGWQKTACKAGRGPGSRMLAAIARGSFRHPYAVMGMTAIIVGSAYFGIRAVVVQDSWIDGFAKTSAFYRATQEFDRGFLGTHILQIVCDTNHTRIEGSLTREVVDHHGFTMPASMIPRDNSLVGWHIRLRCPGDRIPADAHYPVDRWPTDRNTWIENVTITGDTARIDLPRTSGSPLLAMNASRADRLEYLISPRRLVQPEPLARIGELAHHIRGLTRFAVGGVISTADYVETTNLMSRALDEAYRVIPDDPERVAWLWSQYERIRGRERLRQIIDGDFAKSVVTVYLKDANFVDTAQLMQSIRTFERDRLAPMGISIRFAGDVAVSQTLIDSIVSTQVNSLAMSLIGVFIIAAILGRSLRFGLLAMIPCTISIVLNFALMGWMGMPLGVATSMFASMTLGIGVDFAIHLLERYRQARRDGASASDSIDEAAAGAGPAILIDGLGMALGFGVLTLSLVPANNWLGVLVVTSLLGCLASTLLLLPTFIRIIWQRSA